MSKTQKLLWIVKVRDERKVESGEIPAQQAQK